MEICGFTDNDIPTIQVAEFDANENPIHLAQMYFNGNDFCFNGVKDSNLALFRTLQSKEEISEHVGTRGVTVNGIGNTTDDNNSFVNFFKNGAYQGGIVTVNNDMLINALTGMIIQVQTDGITRSMYCSSWSDTDSTNFALRPDAISGSNLGTREFPWYQVHAQNFVNMSDRNAKHDINYFDDVNSTDILMSLKPCSFIYNDDYTEKTNYGLIAQEVEESMKSLGIDTNNVALISKDLDEDGNGINYGLNYVQFIPLIIDTLQEQQKRIDDLETKLAKLEK